MSKKATEFQRKAMSKMYRGKEIFKPLNTGWINENVACVREWVANIFFYRKGDTIWFGADGGYSFISALAEDNKLAMKSLATLEQKLQSRGLHPVFLTGHTGWTDNFEFAFAHREELCSPFKKRAHDPSAPYDAYDESDDTEKMAKSGFLKGVGR